MVDPTNGWCILQSKILNKALSPPTHPKPLGVGLAREDDEAAARGQEHCRNDREVDVRMIVSDRAVGLGGWVVLVVWRVSGCLKTACSTLDPPGRQRSESPMFRWSMPNLSCVSGVRLVFRVFFGVACLGGAGTTHDPHDGLPSVFGDERRAPLLEPLPLQL